MNASPAQRDFLTTLCEERELPTEGPQFEALCEDASASIDVLLSDVESAPITEEQETQIAGLLEVLGPRNDGQEWNIPSDRGRASAFIRKLEGWIKGKEYADRKERVRASLAGQGVGLREKVADVASQAPATEDDIPF
jgi:hypothetical protein